MMPRHFLVMMLVLFIGGCASKTYMADLEPTVEIKGADAGVGKAVFLRVEDPRPAGSFAREGEVYAAGAPLAMRQALATVVEQRVTKALQAQGFQVTQSEISASRRLRVVIRQFGYAEDTGAKVFSFQGEVEAFAQGWEAHFNKRFRSQRRESHFMGLDGEDTAPWVNDVLGDLLSRMVNDPDILNALVR